jgi:hypothetical protein
MEHKNWNQRPLVEFVINFAKTMPETSKSTCQNLLKNELITIQTDLKLFKSCNIRGELDFMVKQWEIKEDVHKLAIQLIS